MRVRVVPQEQRDEGMENMLRPRAADDFAAIRARMEELRREREPNHDVRALERLRLLPTHRLLGD
jgi:hypothetical protein